MRDAGQPEDALSEYLKRAEFGGWPEEVFVSLYNAALLMEQLDRPEAEVLAAYSRASESRPSRAEAWHGAARYCRSKERHEQGFEAARRGLAIPYPKDGLFVQDWIYQYGLLDEFAVHAYWTDRFEECVDAAERLLSEGWIPPSMRDRIVSNRELAAARLRPALDAEQRFEALLRKARWREELQWTEAETLAAYEAAADLCPERVEAFHGASRYCRYRQRHKDGVEYSARGLAAPQPSYVPDAERWIYQHGLLDEFAVHAYWTERYAECLDACDRLLSEGKLPIAERDRVLRNRQFALDRIESNRAQVFIKSDRGSANGPSQHHDIPKVFHFITGLDSDFGGKHFSFVHQMAIRSALMLNEGFRAKVYYHHEPSGKYWDAVKRDVELVQVDLPTEVFGNPVEHFAHKADVLRMRILLEQGGIYLDLDTICQRPFAPLLDGRVVMGQEEVLRDDGSRVIIGLCNATIIAPPEAEFLRLWYDAYRNFTGGSAGDAWNKFSVQTPMTLAQQYPKLLRIEPASSFFWPSWDRVGITSLFSMDCDFPEAYSFHLWESQSWSSSKGN